MKRRIRVREDLQKTFMGSAGWLFADLLLALAMLFLIANTISQPPVQARKPTATPTATAAPPLRLEQGYHRFSITIDPAKLLNNDVSERNAVIQQVKGQTFLHNRSAGLIIIYGGAPTTADIGTALNVANAVYSILIDLGKHDPTFGRVSKYDPLYLLGGDPTVMKLDIFLFAT